MNKEKYNHIEIERKWQKYWQDQGVFEAKVDQSKPKYYILDMFPYPSGAGLHVGHVTGYTATDILARYKRQKGFNVLHPMGWDSFGLQAEQYAVRTGTHPKITTEKNINTYRRQLQSLGFSYDWKREFATSDPSYYKWTQWIFTKLYEKGLAYEAEILVNYCPALGTVLANEEVENGKSKEGGYPVERRPLRQWVLKITAYAERLLEDLEGLDWPEYLKTLQRNWIGKSEGAEVCFEEEKTKEKIFAFTTRADTLFGVTFLAISPEHPLANRIVTPDQKEEVKAYQKATTYKSDLERTDLNTEKSGVWTGSYAKNPVTGKSVPIWIADYVLMGYGTGAVMGVPGGDERDFDFAKHFDLEIIPPYDPLISDEDVPEGMTKEALQEEVLRGNRCWSNQGIAINGKSEYLEINGLSIEEAKKMVISWLEKQQVGRKMTMYKLRDWLFSRQRYWGEPFPILHFEDGTKRLLDLDELPLTLPELSDYKPKGEGQTPLENVPNWVYLTDTKTGKKGKRETNTMPQWAGSCWYYLRFCDPKNGENPWSQEAENYWMPVDMYVGGVEHAVLHLLYARFWHKVLFDLNLVSTSEPFQTLRNQGLVTSRAFKKPGGGYVEKEAVIKEGETYIERASHEPLVSLVEKMSKSKFNGVTPDEIIEELGADSLRLYEMFMGPFDKEKLWNSEAISGCRRFLDRFYQLVTSEKIVDSEDRKGERLAHILVKGVEKDIEGMLFNTAISKMMEFVNHFTKLEKYSKKGLKMATQALSPFAPHLAEECWELLGEKPGTLTYACYPKADPKYLEETSTIYAVQVNGKFRDKWELPKGKTKEDLLKKAREENKVAKYLEGEILKVIFVPDKLINFVVKP
jgi:leucyl-tRNA synthetase